MKGIAGAGHRIYPASRSGCNRLVWRRWQFRRRAIAGHGFARGAEWAGHSASTIDCGRFSLARRGYVWPNHRICAPTSARPILRVQPCASETHRIAKTHARDCRFCERATLLAGNTSARCRGLKCRGGDRVAGLDFVQSVTCCRFAPESPSHLGTNLPITRTS